MSTTTDTAAVAGNQDAPYFQYFPGNYRWSSAMINLIGTAPYGGSDISELHRIGLLLKGKAGTDDQAWFDACKTMGDRIRVQAEGFDAKGHRFSAAHSYLRACNYYQFGERFLTPKTPESDAAYKTAVACFQRHLALGDIEGEVVEVPYGDGLSMPAYFIKARNATSERTPCMVFFGGLDITKEIQFTRGVPDLVKRGTRHTPVADVVGHQHLPRDPLRQSSATPTGRPQALPSSLTKPARKSTGCPTACRWRTARTPPCSPRAACGSRSRARRRRRRWRTAPACAPSANARPSGARALPRRSPARWPWPPCRAGPAARDRRRAGPSSSRASRRTRRPSRW
jgi:hypothetical protein